MIKDKNQVLFEEKIFKTAKRARILLIAFRILQILTKCDIILLIKNWFGGKDYV